MRNFTLLLMACLLSIGIQAQINLSSSEWQADLRYLQEKVHQDYS